MNYLFIELSYITQSHCLLFSQTWNVVSAVVGDGWMDGMDGCGWMDGWMDGMDGWMDDRTDNDNIMHYSFVYMEWQ